MNIKKIIKPSVLLPALIGVAIGVTLFLLVLLGGSDDSPGLILIGFVAAFMLVLWGVYNTGVIKEGFLGPILSFCFGGGGIILSIVLLLDGEFEETPGMALIGVALGVILICIGTAVIRKRYNKKQKM